MGARRAWTNYARQKGLSPLSCRSGGRAEVGLPIRRGSETAFFDMAILAVIAPSFSRELADAVTSKFPRHFEIAPGQYVVWADGSTAQQVGQILGPNGEVGQFVVFSVAGHWGYHRRDLWEWLTINSV